MSLDGYVGFSHDSFFHLHTLLINTLHHFNISFSVGINIIISDLNGIVRLRLFLSFISFTLYIFVISPDDGQKCRPKHVTCKK